MSHLKKTKKKKNHELLEDQAFTIYNYSSKKNKIIYNHKNSKDFCCSAAKNKAKNCTQVVNMSTASFAHGHDP